MNCTSEKSGLTLLEIIISVAMLGILVVSFSTFFSTGFEWVAKAGDSSQALFQSQKLLETAILDESGTASEVFTFDFGATTFDVPGKIETSSGEVAIQVFVPILSTGGGTPPNTDLETIQAALDGINALSVDKPGNKNGPNKPTILLPGSVSSITFTFSGYTTIPNALINIATGEVTRDTTGDRTGTITLKGQLNGKMIEKIFNVSIPQNQNNNSGNVTVVAQ